MNFYNRLIPRLNGAEIEERFGYYLKLVKKGVAGFIIFGGELETLKAKIKELQGASQNPLIIASDLEQGLGQHVNGGTIFPPAMAIGSAIKKTDSKTASKLLKKVYTAFAHEAGYAGINTIFAPVLDINTNPRNPIIATRAFGEDAETVSYHGCEMIRTLQENNIMACGKHFPGHGDTDIDSHISLPVIRKELTALENNEFVPFRRAIEAGVRMIMLAHLNVPALEPSGKPVSLSPKAVSYLRDQMGFKGLVITDAMNMGSIGEYTEEDASLMALEAGVDIVLHPSDPDRVAALLKQKNCKSFPLHISYIKPPDDIRLDINEHIKLSEELTKMAVIIDGKIGIRKPFIVALNDEKGGKGISFAAALKEKYPETGHYIVMPHETAPLHMIPEHTDLIVCVFSSVKAWKSDTRQWLQNTISTLKDRAAVFISFGNPYILSELRNQARIFAFWDSEMVQKIVAEEIVRINL